MIASDILLAINFIVQIRNIRGEINTLSDTQKKIKSSSTKKNIQSQIDELKNKLIETRSILYALENWMKPCDNTFLFIILAPQHVYQFDPKNWPFRKCLESVINAQKYEELQQLLNNFIHYHPLISAQLSSKKLDIILPPLLSELQSFFEKVKDNNLNPYQILRLGTPNQVHFVFFTDVFRYKLSLSILFTYSQFDLFIYLLFFCQIRIIISKQKRRK